MRGRVPATVGGAVFGVSASTMSAVAPMHEHVQQGASQEEEPGQIRDGGHDVGSVLRYEEIPSDHEEADENNIDARPKKSASFARVIAVIHRFPRC